MTTLPELEPGDEWRIVFYDHAHDMQSYVVASVVKPPSTRRGGGEDVRASAVSYVRDDDPSLTPTEVVDNVVERAVTNAHRAYLVRCAFRDAEQRAATREGRKPDEGKVWV